MCLKLVGLSPLIKKISTFLQRVFISMPTVFRFFEHANLNFVSILNYVITFYDQAIPRKNPPVKPPARYTFSAANS